MPRHQSLNRELLGPISAALLVPTTKDVNDDLSIQQLTQIRNYYETTLALRRHVDIHLVLQPGGLTEDGQVITSSGYQESRNLARLFSRTEFVALVPVQTIWMTEISESIKKYQHILRGGDLLILPTFGFPNYEGVDTDNWPTDKQSMIEWVDEGQMGLLDYSYELNNGPTAYSTWKETKEPYLVPNYDFNYGPIFISTRLHHPWCEERFEDHVSSCLYTKYLAGAELWVMPNDYAVRTGQEPADSLNIVQVKHRTMVEGVFYLISAIFLFSPPNRKDYKIKPLANIVLNNAYSMLDSLINLVHSNQTVLAMSKRIALLHYPIYKSRKWFLISLKTIQSINALTIQSNCTYIPTFCIIPFNKYNIYFF